MPDLSEQPGAVWGEAAGALHIECVHRHVEIRCAARSTLDVLRKNFAAMERPPARPHIVYEVEAGEGREGLRVYRVGSGFDARASDAGALIYMLESDLVVELQLLRPDLVFLHAAALRRGGRAYLLVGRSGAGKSTTCWGLLRHGFGYFSDEMVPVAATSGAVLGYPHALCMKREPPAGFEAPAEAMRTSRGIHIPLSGGGVQPVDQPLPLGGIFVVSFDPMAKEASTRPIGRAETAARIYPQILNALAHPGDGLAAAAAIAAAAPGYELDAARLADTCQAVERCIDSMSD